MKRPSSESAIEKPARNKKLKNDSQDKLNKQTSPGELKSILKKSTINKKSSVGNKKPKLKTIDGEPKESVVKSKLLDQQDENEDDETEMIVETDRKKIFKNKSKVSKDNKNAKFKQKSMGDKESQPVDKKEERKKQKELRLKRREKDKEDKGYVLPQKSKKIFEELRCSKCSAERRKELADELFKVLSGKFVNSARSHELSRMTQWIIKLSSPEVRSSTVDEVIRETVSLSKIKYANHIVLCMIQDCDKKVRKRLLDQFLGNITDLIRNKFAAPIIEEYYSKYAKTVEKAYIRQELYSDLFRGSKNKSLIHLSEVLLQNPTLKSAILKTTKMTLSKLIDKPFALSTNLVTDVLYDYLQNCEDQDKLDIMEILKTNLNLLFKTKSGNQIMMLLMWESTPKVKKHMVKELKTKVLEIAKSSGNIFLRSLFDSIDDTVLIKKAILPTILDNAEDLVKDINGKKVIVYLVAHRDTTFFHPVELEQLKKADESSYVKKDISLKEKELLAPCLDRLLDKIKNDPAFWLSEGKIGLVTHAILSKGSGEKLAETFNAICTYFIECVKSDNLCPVEDAGIHIVLKKLLKNSQVEGNVKSFAECLIEMCDSEVINKLISVNRGCFLLLIALETNLDSILSHLKDVLKGEKIKKKLEKQESAGAQVLFKRLIEKNII